MRELPGGASEGGGKEGRRGPVVVVSGPPGGGKSTYARLLARDLGLEYFTAGKIFREIAREKGLSLVELSRLAEEDPSIDLEIERRTIEVASRGGVVIDSHLAGWVLAGIADVLIYIKAPPAVRGMRIAEREGRDPWDALAESIRREWSQRRRFREYYGIPYGDISHYHLVVDTSVLAVEEAYRVIKEAVTAILRRKGFKV